MLSYTPMWVLGGVNVQIHAQGRYLSLLIPYLRKPDWIQDYSYNNATLTCLLQNFLEQQRRKWKEHTVGMDLASAITLMNTHLSCLLRREKIENCWLVDLPRSPSALKFCHSVTALLRAFTVVKQCIVGYLKL